MHVSPDGPNKTATRGSEGQDEKKKGDVWTLIRRSPQGLKVSTCVHKSLMNTFTLLWRLPFSCKGCRIFQGAPDLRPGLSSTSLYRRVPLLTGPQMSLHAGPPLGAGPAVAQICAVADDRGAGDQPGAVPRCAARGHGPTARTRLLLPRCVPLASSSSVAMEEGSIELMPC